MLSVEGLDSWPDFEEIFYPDSLPRAVPWLEISDASLPLLDVGPGRGVTTVAWAKAVPDAHIIAVEPDPDYRRLLNKRLHAVGLAQRVEVIPLPIEEAPLPHQLGAVCMFGVLYWISPSRRAQLWRSLGRRLAPGSMVVTESGGGPRLVTAEKKLVDDIARGALSFERWVGSIVTDPDSGILRNVVKVMRDGQLLAVHEFDSPFHKFTQVTREREIEASGMFEVMHGPALRGGGDFTCARRS